MKGFGRFFQEKFGKLQEKVTENFGKVQEDIGKAREKVSENLNTIQDKISTDVATYTAKINEKVGRDGPVGNYDVNLDKVIKNLALWFLTVVQEPSLGLFYVQNHFKESLERTLEFKKEINDFDKKLTGSVLDIQKTKKEVEEIGQLNGVWSNSMADLLDQLEKTYEK